MGSTPLAERVTASIQHSDIGHQVLSHLKRFITETPEADGSLLELLEEKLQTSGYHQSLQNAIYHRLCQEIEKSELGSDEVPFLEEAQLRWQTNLVRSLKSTAKELGLPLCRKRTVGEQNLIEDRWFDLGQEEIELLAIRPMYSPQDLLDYLLSTTTPSDKITDDDAESSSIWTQAAVSLRTKDITELREILKVPMFEIPDSLDVDSEEYEAFAQLIYDTNDVLAAREFLKRGCPQSMRKVFWLKVLGVSSAERSDVEFEYLKGKIVQYEFLVDQLVLKDVRLTAMNDVEYFVFDDTFYQIMLAFIRDTQVAKRLRGNKPKESGDCKVPHLPCGVIPFYGISLFVAPLCFLYEDVAQMYAVFREMYCRYFHKLTTVSSNPQGIVSLAVTFERLLQCKEPELLPTLRSKNINLLPTVFQMLMHCFCQRLPVKEVLKLWDRILAYDSLYILPVLAASLVCSKKEEILNMKDQSCLEDIFCKMNFIEIVPALEHFLNPLRL
ncbi:TBC1 domain family member 19 isoform X1 [Ixodes scapularis]|uniref:TBC1 domain family member 19 isoform X1 n=1 Tax=Ixodes scapularis TaxID=6945 RepID=UPI001C39419D|nr:TBC1 domain family member 19 isoform X1 [Ixodes scapularis]